MSLSIKKICEWFLLGLALYLPFEPFVLKWLPDTVYVVARYAPETLLYFACISAGMMYIRSRVSGKKMPLLLIPFILLILDGLFSLALNNTPLALGILGIRQVVRFILVYFLVWLLDSDTVFVKRLLMILFGVLFFQSILAIAQSIIGAPLDAILISESPRFFGDIQLTTGVPHFWAAGERVFGTMGRYDQLGIFLTTTLLLITGFLYERKKKADVRQYLLFFVVAIPALLLSYSRAAWFGLLLGIFCIGFCIKGDRRVALGMGVIALIACGSILCSLATHQFLIDVPQQSLSHRFFEAFSLERWKGEYTGLGRLFFAVETPRKVIPLSPIIGVGPGSYGGGVAAAFGHHDVYDRAGIPFGVYGTEGYIDNNWLSLWAEFGTLGLAFYLWMIILIIRQSVRVYHTTDDPFFRALTLGFLGICAAVIFQALLGTYLEMRTLAYYFWLLAGVICVEAIRLARRPNRLE